MVRQSPGRPDGEHRFTITKLNQALFNIRPCGFSVPMLLAYTLRLPPIGCPFFKSTQETVPVWPVLGGGL